MDIDIDIEKLLTVAKDIEALNILLVELCAKMSNLKENVSGELPSANKLSPIITDINNISQNNINEIITKIKNIVTMLVGKETNIDELFGSINQENVYTQGDYNITASELLEIYTSYWTPDGGRPALRKLTAGESLYTLYDQVDETGKVIAGSGKKYIEDLITATQNEYSGRAGAVNTTMLMLKLAADKGVKMDYISKGTQGIEPYVPTEAVASGVDCNPFVSWAVDKGTPGGFQWRGVAEFDKVGEQIPYENWDKAQPGDVFVLIENGVGHVGIILENNPETKQFTCAEANGSNTGIIVQNRNYESMRAQNYNVQDMTNVYNGTENTNREIFNQYVDWETYQRKV